MSQVKHDLAGWIDTSVIAEATVDGLEGQEVPATLESGQSVWLDVLEQEISDAIRRSVTALIDRGDLVSKTE